MGWLPEYGVIFIWDQLALLGNLLSAMTISCNSRWISLFRWKCFSKPTICSSFVCSAVKGYYVIVLKSHSCNNLNSIIVHETIASKNY